MAADFLNIPGDIRQQYMPFTIAGPGVTQLFSYKENPSPRAALIHPFSKHLQTLIANDSSFQYTHGENSPQKIDYKDFLNAMPGIQIREFVPDAKLTQTFKWFSYLKQGFDAAVKSIESEAAGDWKAVKDKFSKAWDAIGEKMQGLTSGNAPILAEVAAGLTHYYRDREFNVGPDAGFAVLFIPFLLYYRLTTTHTNNIYEIPYSMKNNIMESDGTYGWGDDNGSDFPLIEAIGKKFTGVASMLMPGLGSTIKVNAMPSFNPSGSARSSEFTISFDLINDSDAAAVNNFLMCHTLFGNNRWLQYGFVQTGASLYDVKLPGANRYFMCKGRFVCKGKGGFRTPSQKVIEDIVSHHGADLVKETIKESWQKTNENGDSVAQVIGRARARNTLRKEIGNSDQASGQASRAVVREKASNKTPAQIEQIEINGALAKKNALYTSTFDGDRTTTIVLKNNGEDFGKPIAVTNSTAEYKDAAEQIKNAKERIVEQNGMKSDASRKISTINEDAKNFLKAKADFESATPGTPEYDAAEEAYDRASAALYKAAPFPEEPKPWNELPAEEKEWYQATAINVHVPAAIDNQTVTIANADSLIKTSEEEIESAREKLNDVVLESSEQFDELASAYSDLTLEQASGHVDALNSVWKDLIKIPDVYSLELTFSSLIPDNFNNYLYGWRADNLDPIENYFKGGVNEVGAMEQLVQQLIKAIGGEGG